MFDDYLYFELGVLRRSGRSKAPLPSLHGSSPPFPARKKFKKSDRPCKYNEIRIHIKNYTYEIASCAGALSPRSSTACSRCTGSETLRSPSLSIELLCDGPRTARKKGHLPHGSGIFPAATDTDDGWPFWCAITQSSHPDCCYPTHFTLAGKIDNRNA
jgi:hypothetical protein